MERHEFIEQMNRMTVEFDKRLSQERTRAWFSEFGKWSIGDFKDAVTAYIDNPKNRSFPRMGEFKSALWAAYAARKRLEWDRMKEEERRAVAEIMAGVEGDSIRSENKNRLKRLYGAMDKGVDAVKKLAREWGGDTENPPLNKWGCVCEDGLVFVRDPDGYSAVGGCSRCKRGPVGYPFVDPLMVDPKTKMIRREKGGSRHGAAKI